MKLGIGTTLFEPSVSYWSYLSSYCVARLICTLSQTGLVAKVVQLRESDHFWFSVMLVFSL